MDGCGEVTLNMINDALLSNVDCLLYLLPRRRITMQMRRYAYVAGNLISGEIVFKNQLKVCRLVI